jgi:RNA polymerase sigma-70 factor, ECF subfamily
MAAVEPERAAAPATTAAHLYERQYRRVLSYCLWRLGKREDAEDAAQTTFLNALQALSRGARPGAEAAWLLTIAQNVCRERWRTQVRRAPELPSAPESLAAIAAPETDPELVQRLHEALAGLPEPQRRSFVLREWQGLSYAEIAVELGTTEPAVASLVFRARHALIEALRDERPVTRGVERVGGVASVLGWLKSLLGGSAAKLTLAAAVATVTVATTIAVPLTQVGNRTREQPRPQEAHPAAATSPRPKPGAAPATADHDKAAQGSTNADRRQRRASSRPSIQSAPQPPRPAAAPVPTAASASTRPSDTPAPGSTAPPPTDPVGDAATTLVDPVRDAASQLPVPTPSLPSVPSVPSAPSVSIPTPPLDGVAPTP